MSAFVAEGVRKQALNVIRHFEGRLPACTGELLRQLLEEMNFVNGPEIQVAEEGVHGFVAPRCGPVKHGCVRLDSHWDDAVTELGEQG